LRLHGVRRLSKQRVLPSCWGKLMLKASVDTSQLDRVFTAIIPAVQSNVQQALSREIAKVQDAARRTHRHRTRTGTLSRSLQTTVAKSEAELYIEDSISEYGEFVVSGHGSWAPDQFLEQALVKKEAEIVKSVEDAVEHAIRGVV
jgi:hypothetical protein